jgi:hypothetical protein
VSLMAARRPPTDEEYWRRLESAGPLLTAARLRYRALLPAVRAWGWRARLRDLADVARATAAQDAEVVAALERAERRAAQEGWAAGEVRTLLEETRLLRDALTQRASVLSEPVLSEPVLSERVLSEPVEDRPSPSLSRSLHALLSTVIGVPRAVARGDRDAAAAEALSLEPPLSPTLAHLAATLERVFGRPVQRGRPLPFTREEFDDAWAAREAGIAALSRGWAAVRRIDTTGGVERELQRRAKRGGRSPRAAPDAARALARAAFWSEATDAALDAALAERFAPVQVKPEERAATLRFLLARERDGAARLAEETPRAALLMLAHELAATPEERAPLTGGRAQVHAWAVAADQLVPDDDHRRLLEGLRTLSARTLRGALPPLYRVGRTAERSPPPATLAELFPG